MPRKVLATLDLNGPLFLTGAVGTSGQFLTSAGAGATPTWTSVSGGAMNYVQTLGTKQSAVSTAGTIIVSGSITTNGYPIQVTVTGDVENNSAGGWVTLQLYRGSTAIGNIVHAEGSAGSENSPYALTVIDAPAAGTYTYSLKLNSSAGGTFNFGESNGPVLTMVELSGRKGDAGAAGATFTGGTLTSSLTLRSGTSTAATAPLYWGTSTPALLTTAVQGAMEYDGLAFYATPSVSATTGRAVLWSPNYITFTTSPDLSISAAAVSILDGATKGITLLAGTTYEFELHAALRYQSFGDTTTALSIGYNTSTVSGTPTVAWTEYLEYATNTTGFTTAATLSTIRKSTGTTQILTSPGASGSRYAIYKAKGIITVTGTGSIKFYPTLVPSASTANVPTYSSGSFFMVTPLGNGTFTQVGAWA